LQSVCSLPSFPPSLSYNLDFCTNADEDDDV
jgi:uncharacterized membrane protein YeiB